jgi:outer membrane protein insertion porin family
MNAFVNNEGNAFNQGLITLGWTRNKLNSPIFPLEGTYQTLSAQISTPLVGEDLNYYKLNYNFKGYFPLPYDFIGNLIANAGYGNGYGSTRGLPFFANYYAGGLGVQGEVRGYDTNSLGPKDSLGFAYGGNVLLSGTAQLILPKPLRSDSFRVATFLDAGQVYDTWNVYNTLNSSGAGQQTGIHLGDLRYSAGVDFEVRIPVMNAVLEFALAKALNAKAGDKSQFFSFNVGTSF